MTAETPTRDANPACASRAVGARPAFDGDPPRGTDMTGRPNEEINATMIATAERLAAAGVPRDEVPHCMKGAGLALLDVVLCGDCLLETLEEVEAKIREAERHAQ
jgi:hypothetical protein